MAGGIQSPEKELRFTRSGQAVLFWLASAVFGAVAITMLATSPYRQINPLLPHPIWALLPLLIAVMSWRLAWRLTRHAYVLLTPLGIEIFPFFRPAAGMTLVPWQQIASVEVDAGLTRLTLHHDDRKSSGIHLSLRPIRADKREWLIKALAGRGKMAHQQDGSQA
jgi:hypothetical protein